MPCRLVVSRPLFPKSKNDLCSFRPLNPGTECYSPSLFPQKAQKAGAVLTPGLPLCVTQVTDLEREALSQLLP